MQARKIVISFALEKAYIMRLQKLAASNRSSISYELRRMVCDAMDRMPNGLGAQPVGEEGREPEDPAAILALEEKYGL